MITLQTYASLAGVPGTPRTLNLAATTPANTVAVLEGFNPETQTYFEIARQENLNASPAGVSVSQGPGTAYVGEWVAYAPGESHRSTSGPIPPPSDVKVPPGLAKKLA